MTETGISASIRTVLIIQKDEARESISRQLDEGKGINEFDINNYEELEIAKDRHRIWRCYTRKLLLRLFNTENIAEEFYDNLRLAKPVRGKMQFSREVELFRTDVGRDIDQLSNIYQQLELISYAPSEKNVHKPEKLISNNPWLWGSFYLIAFATLVMLSIFVYQRVGITMSALVVVVVLIFFTVLGAFILSLDKSVCEKNFWKLIIMVYKQLPDLFK